MLPRHHRRRISMIGEPQRQKPKLLVRLAVAAIVLFILWYIVSTILAYFDGSIERKSAAMLTVRSGDSVEVSLQGGEWQRGESNLKLYAGDGVAVRGNADAILTFFDGTRVRLEQGSEISIAESSKLLGSTSAIGLDIKSGRIWASTATLAAFTGSITREFTTTNFVATVPSESNVLVSSSLVNVVRASGLGVQLKFTIPKAKIPDVYVGEGQYFSLTEDAIISLKNGRDPYTFRDPVTQQLLRDEFLISSYSLFTSSGNLEPQGSGSSSSQATTIDSEDLTLTTPVNHEKISTKTVKVSGTVSERVATLRVNGQNIVLSTSRTFSVDVSLSKEKTTTIKIEAEDEQGITLASMERTVENFYNVKVEPIRFKSPVGSGETLKTSLQEIEITGEAPAGTKTVVVNDYALQLFKPGSKTWSYLASVKLGNLREGTNVYAVYATDADDNKSPIRSIIIEYSANGSVSGSFSSDQSSSSTAPIKQNPPLTPGTLAVTGPVSGTSAETSDKEVVLEGTTSAETNTISINGYSLTLYVAGKTTWNYIASTELQTMKRGKNVYRIVSRNSNGEILDILEYTITYNP